jgi:hypothetical protein
VHACVAPNQIAPNWCLLVPVLWHCQWASGAVCHHTTVLSFLALVSVPACHGGGKLEVVPPAGWAIMMVQLEMYHGEGYGL